jgi:hypothetical protein
MTADNSFHSNLGTDHKPNLRLVPRSPEGNNPLKDPNREMFHAAIDVIARPPLLRLIEKIPHSGEIFRTELTNAVYIDTKSVNPGSDLRRLIERQLSKYIVEGKSGIAANNKTHMLTKEGRVLKSAVQTAVRFLIENQYGISPRVFVNGNGHDLSSHDESSTVIRTEMILALAKAGEDGLRQIDLVRLLDKSSSVMPRAFEALSVAGVITVDNNHRAHLTELGKSVVSKVFLPLAQATGVSAAMLLPIAQNVGYSMTETALSDKKETSISPKEQEARSFIAIIRDNKQSARVRENAWFDLRESQRELLHLLIAMRKSQFPAAEWEELESFALEGIMGAVSDFDETKGSFLPLMRVWINNLMNNYTDKFKRDTRRNNIAPMTSLDEMTEDSDNENPIDSAKLLFLADYSYDPNVVVKDSGNSERIVGILLDLGFPPKTVQIFVDKYAHGIGFIHMPKEVLGMNEKTARLHVEELIKSVRSNSEARRRLLEG